MKIGHAGICASFAIALGAALPAWAADVGTASATSLETQARALDRDAVGQGAARVQGRISADFSDWAGSTENANALVNGLRAGQPVTLTAGPAAAGSAGIASTTFTPPTRPMGYGNVYVSLALAKAQLEAQGITAPTPLQLQAALVGVPASPTGEPRGVLQLRSEGMGWGRIAQAYDLKLGPVMADLKAARTDVGGSASGSAPWTRASGRAEAAAHPTPASRGIVTAAGRPAPTIMGRGYASGSNAHATSGLSISAARGAVAPGVDATGNGQGRALGHFK